MSTNATGTIGRFQTDYGKHNVITGCFSMTDLGKGNTDGSTRHDTCASITIDVSHVHEYSGTTTSQSSSTTSSTTSTFSGVQISTSAYGNDDGSASSFSTFNTHINRYCWERIYSIMLFFG